MVGKIKRVRQKLHHNAVKLDNSSQDTEEKTRINLINRIKPVLKADKTTTEDIKVFNFPKGIFAGTEISREALVQTLKYDQPAKVQESSVEKVEEKTGKEEKKQMSKKEKMKERRERWLNKIRCIKLEREQQVALQRRKATPVVGDMKPLADALPELDQLRPLGADSAPRPVPRKQRGPVKRKPEPTDYYQMKPAQKRKLLESEISRFGEVQKTSAFKTNALAAIGEHLRKRLRQEDEQT